MLTRTRGLSVLRCCVIKRSNAITSTPTMQTLRQCSTKPNTKVDSKNEFKFTWKSFAVGALACVATGAYFENQKREKLEESKCSISFSHRVFSILLNL